MKNTPRSDILRRAHDFCLANRSDIRASKQAGCFYCCSVFEPREIDDWIPDTAGKTALCPRCGVDSVIPENAGFPLTEEFLREMYDYWFS